MPNIFNGTVATGVLDPLNNNSRKMIILDNGWIIASGRDESAIKRLYLYVNKQDGNGFNPICYVLYNTSGGTIYDWAIESKGTTLYILTYGYKATYVVKSMKIDLLTQANVGIDISDNTAFPVLDTMTDWGSVALAFNPQKTELHAAYAGKTSLYPNSSNVKYTKATLDAQGNTVWDALTYATSNNSSGVDNTNVTLAVKADNFPIMAYQQNTGSNNYIDVVYKLSAVGQHQRTAHSTGSYSYKTAYPCLIFVPSSINGLPMGRLWLVFNYTNNISQFFKIRGTYSDDGGATWVAAFTIYIDESNNNNKPSLTANKLNEIFCVWYGKKETEASSEYIKMKKWANGSWGNLIDASPVGDIKMNPATLFDPYFKLDFSSPLFIYRDYGRNAGEVTKLGFAGTWMNTSINVPEGNIGIKTDRNNLLSYSIINQDLMTTITEKVNGVTIGSKTAASGESLTVQLTQAQWDAISFGKYANASGSLNTLTIEMGSNKWTYTFDKRLAENAPMESAIEAYSDLKNIFLPSVKSKISSAITAKGGTALAADPFETIMAGLNTLGDASTRKIKVGSFNAASAASYNITGLTFKPSIILAFVNDAGSTSHRAIFIHVDKTLYAGGSVSKIEQYQYNATSLFVKERDLGTNTSFSNITETGFTINFISWTTSYNFFYIAIQ